ncbi:MULTISPECIES: hypothetical protein [unclassified Mycobacterium]|uniref:hypothetical protein n=1 Tax=unclassified Mycobacterium TaxID=2642494 RepID=UPI00048F8D95|nr:MULTISPECIES: hypothetical protein [unclassified Mycobacterium]SEA00887.1 hypothetical protein SAMN04488580_101457 [Mycobacterium sp. 283mftsu]
MSAGQPLPPAPVNRTFAVLVVGAIVAVAVVVTGGVMAIRGLVDPGITNLEASMAVGRQDFPDWPTARFDGPTQSTATRPSTEDVSPQSCVALAGAPSRQAVQVQLKKDTHHALAVWLRLPYTWPNYAEAARTCTRYTINDLLVIDVDRRPNPAALPAWVVTVRETVSARGGLVTPFMSVKVLGQYRGVSVTAICLMTATDPPQTCDKPLASLFTAQVHKLAAV